MSAALPYGGKHVAIRYPLKESKWSLQAAERRTDTAPGGRRRGCNDLSEYGLAAAQDTSSDG